MFKPLNAFVAMRYLQSRRESQYVSFISAASMIGIALGVAALIVILSVMNGFETELRQRLLSMSAHVTLRSAAPPLADWRRASAVLGEQDGVVATAPYVRIEGMLALGKNLQGALVRGIDPELESAVSRIDSFMQEGSLDDLSAGGRGVVLGRVLAIRLGAGVGDQLRLLVPRAENGRLSPRLAGFTVVGVFEAGIADHDGSTALIHIADAEALLGWSGVTGVRGVLQDPMAVTATAQALRGSVPKDLEYSDWTIENRTYFSAIRIEKTMMSLILMLIVAVAAFNIVATLVMVVTDKEQDIAILRTLGLPPQAVGRIFLLQGAVIGLIGTLVGVGLGLLLAANVDVIVPWLETSLGFKIMPGDVYYVTDIPSEIHLSDVLIIPIVAFALTLLATLYPSGRAASVEPARALRYE